MLFTIQLKVVARMPGDSEPDVSDPEDSVIDWPQGSPITEDRRVIVSVLI